MRGIKKLFGLMLLCVFTFSLGHAEDVSMKTAYFAGGCFWGVEYYLEAQRGVKEVTSGFMGGFTENPVYEEVVDGTTGHIETVEVVYDPSMVSYEALAKRFFEIHDFTQVGGQGPDIGERYESYIFYTTPQQKETAYKLINILTQKGYKVATRVVQSSTFYAADSYHQDYYRRHHKKPYCHVYKKIFD